MSIAKGTFSLSCNNCKKQHNVYADEADFECIGGDSDRGMGNEICIHGSQL